jgi:hypothetical protein
MSPNQEEKQLNKVLMCGKIRKTTIKTLHIFPLIAKSEKPIRTLPALPQSALIIRIHPNCQNPNCHVSVVELK